MTHPNDRPHNSTGRFQPSQDTADRAAWAASLKADNPRITYQAIADTVGYSNRGDAYRAVQRCREAVLREAGAELIASEAQQLDDLFAAALEVLERDHLTVSHGHIVRDDDGQPIIDDGPKLAAIDRLLRIRESYRKLYGADSPVKVDATVHEVTQQDVELQEMLRDAKAKMQIEEQQIIEGGAGG